MITNSVRLLSVCLVLFVFLFANFCPFLVFKVLDARHAGTINHITANAQTQELIKLQIPWHELNNSELFNYEQEDYENEIIYRGHIYNISKEVVTDEGITFYCVNDTYEEYLMAKLNDFTQGDSGKLPDNAAANPFSKKCSDFLAVKYLAPKTTFINLFQYSKLVFPLFNDIFQEVLTPPPLQA